MRGPHCFCHWKRIISLPYFYGQAFFHSFYARQISRLNSTGTQRINASQWIKLEIVCYSRSVSLRTKLGLIKLCQSRAVTLRWSFYCWLISFFPFLVRNLIWASDYFDVFIMANSFVYNFRGHPHSTCARNQPNLNTNTFWIWYVEQFSLLCGRHNN